MVERLQDINTSFQGANNNYYGNRQGNTQQNATNAWSGLPRGGAGRGSNRSNDNGQATNNSGYGGARASQALVRASSYASNTSDTHRNTTGNNGYQGNNNCQGGYRNEGRPWNDNRWRLNSQASTSQVNALQLHEGEEPHDPTITELDPSETASKREDSPPRFGALSAQGRCMAASVKEIHNLYFQAIFGVNKQWVMVDSGATHNFMTPQCAHKLGIQTCNVEDTIVKFPQGNDNNVKAACSLRMQAGPWSTRLDFLILPMDSFEAIVGLSFVDKYMLYPSSYAASRKEKAALRAVIIEDDRPADASGRTTEARESEDEALDTPKSRSPLSEGRVPRTRGKGTKKKVQEKASTEHAQVSVSDKLRRSHRLLKGTAECPGLETATVDVTRSTYPVSEGRVLRKRGVISDQQTEMRALPASDKVNEPDNLGTGDIAVKTTISPSPISEGRVLRKRNVPPDEQASPESKNVNISKSPRRSSRPSNGVGESLGLEVSETSKVAATIVLSEARVLRKRSIAIDQKVHQPGSIESDDDETTMTWRSRRRKVQ
ncbi:hypothetical protein L7F22_057607 [Adiantum nelumboides]|nr:hypothetical protein [Adiantum nelumboides]